MGYGLADLEHEGWRLTDPRINPDSPLVDKSIEVSAVDYAAWLRRQRRVRIMQLDEWYLREHDPEKTWITDASAYSPEHGLPNVLVIRPLAMQGPRGWERYDDPIDVVEETCVRKPVTNDLPTNYVKTFEDGFYPFAGLFMNARNGKRLDDKVIYWLRARETEGIPQEVRETLAKEMGFRSHAEAEKHVAPLVPEEVRDLVTYAKLFTHPNGWRQLRPMIYTYWA